MCAFKPITADVRKATNQFKQGTKWNLAHAKEGVTSWIGASQNIEKRLQDRMHLGCRSRIYVPRW